MPQENFEAAALRANKLIDEVLAILGDAQRQPGLDYAASRSLDSIRREIGQYRQKLADLANRKDDRSQQPQLRSAAGGTSDTAAKIASLFTNARTSSRDQIERSFQDIERGATMQQLEDAAKSMGIQHRFRSTSDAISYMKNAILERMGISKRV